MLSQVAAADEYRNYGVELGQLWVLILDRRTRSLIQSHSYERTQHTEREQLLSLHDDAQSID